MSTEQKVILAVGMVLALAIFGGASMHGYLLASRSVDGLTVTGSVKKNVTADLAKWTASFTRRAGLSDLKSVLQKTEHDRAALLQFFIASGLTDKDVTFLPLQTNAIYEQLPGYGYTQNVVGYNLVQEVRVESVDIDRVEALGKAVSKIIDLGLVPDFQRTEYFYTHLSDLRPQLFAEATLDAKTRAEAIAHGTGVQVGNLMSARTGVIQVTAPNTTDVSDYGAYDLSTRAKEISATVSVTFRVR